MSNADARRAYWTEQLEAARDFMLRAARQPVAECGESLVDLPEAAQAAGVRVRFSESPHVLGLPRIHQLRAGLVPGFLAAAAAMNRRGWILHVEDGYRTREMQRHLGRHPAVFDAILRTLRWELGGALPTPEFFLRRSMALVALRPKVGTHMSASAIDLSVFRADDGREVDRGAPYLEMSELTPMDSPFASPEARRNRREITAVMREHGFFEYPYEFWHYNSGDVYEAVLLGSAAPARYGAVDWNPADGRVTPTADPEQPLNSAAEIGAEIERALHRQPK
jgi:D-alanyl-D-alanine dipeptidase